MQIVALQVSGGKTVAVHCRAGTGRSSSITAGVLICSGLTADDALGLIAAAWGIEVPDTEAQRDWVKAFGNRSTGSDRRFSGSRETLRFRCPAFAVLPDLNSRLEIGRRVWDAPKVAPVINARLMTR